MLQGDALGFVFSADVLCLCCACCSSLLFLAGGSVFVFFPAAFCLHFTASAALYFLLLLLLPAPGFVLFSYVTLLAFCFLHSACWRGGWGRYPQPHFLEQSS